MPPLSPLEDPEHWLQRAKETRALAEAIADIESKRTMLKIAEEYEKLALQASQRVVALIAEFENDIRHERQMDGIAKAKKRGVRFGRKSLLLPETIKEIRSLREAGTTVPEIIRRMGLSKASVYRALAASAH
jgi:DNA invertase Pin-like site-specific DNA recombinase